MFHTLRKKRGRKPKRTIRKKRQRKQSFRKHKTKRRGGVASNKKTSTKVDWSKRAGVSSSAISRQGRQATMAAKREAEAAAAAIRASEEAEREAEAKAKRADKARLKMLEEQATRAAAMAAQTRWAPRQGAATWLNLTNPATIRALWHKNFEAPLKLVAEKTRTDAEANGYSKRRVDHEVHLAVMEKFNQIFRANRIHGMANFPLNKMLTDKYYKNRDVISAAVLIRYYKRASDRGERIPPKAIQRLTGFLTNQKVMDELTPDEKRYLEVILDRDSVGFGELEDIATVDDDLPDNAFEDLQDNLETVQDAYDEEDGLLPFRGGRRSRSQRGGMNFDEAMAMMGNIEQSLKVIMGQATKTFDEANTAAADAEGAGAD